MEKQNRALVLVLALSLSVSLCSVGARAEGEEADAVAKRGNVGYSAISDAVSAADAGDTVTILQAGTYTLPNLPKNITIEGGVNGVVFSHTTAGNIASVTNGATFKNLAFEFGKNDYHGFQHAGKINMDGCTLNGKLFSYGDMEFTGCTFNAPDADYAMWDYSGNVTYTDCTFNGYGKFLNVYNEDSTTADKPWEITATGCRFISSKSNKAAFNVKETCGAKPLDFIVRLSDCSTNENFPTASESTALCVITPLVQVDDRKESVEVNITVYINDVLAWEENRLIKYDVTWKTADGKSETTPTGYGTIPTHAASSCTDAQYTYTFKEWSPTPTAVTGEATYTATYTAELRSYTVKFLNHDGTELQSSEVPYGTVPTYTGATPTRTGDDYTYTFNDWTPAVKAVTGDASYTATFTGNPNEYLIRFVNADGTLLQSGMVAKDTMPTYSGTPTKDSITVTTSESPTTYTFTFTGWDSEIAAATEEKTYTATYSVVTGSGSPTVATEVETTGTGTVATTTIQDTNAKITETVTESQTTDADKTTVTSVTETNIETANAVGTSDTETTKVETTTVTETGGSSTSTSTTTTSSEKYTTADATITYTAATEKTVTTTVSGETSTTTESKTVTVTLSAAASEASVSEAVTNDAAKTAAAQANNTISAAQVDIAAIVADALSAASLKNEDGSLQDGSAAVSLELRTTLNQADIQEENSGTVSTMTYDVTPYAVVKQGKTTVSEEPIGDKLSDTVKNATEDAGKIEVTLPLPSGFASGGATVQVIHKGTGSYEDESFYPTVQESAGNLYVAVHVTHFSDFAVKATDKATLSYDANGGSGAMSSTEVGPNTDMTVAANAFTRSGYTFSAWNTKEDGAGTPYQSGDTLTLAGDVTLYAQWTARAPSSSSNSGTSNTNSGESGTVTAELVRAPEGGYTVSGTKNEDGTVRVTVEDSKGNTSSRVSGGVRITIGSLAEGEVAVLVDAETGEELDLLEKSIVEGSTAYVLLDGSATVKVKNNAKPFTDVSATTDEWIRSAVTFASSHELFRGVEDGSRFAPMMDMSRAMLVTVLYRLENRPETAAESLFADVQSGVWYTEAMRWATAQGITRGYDDGRFHPDESLTREQLASLLRRYLTTTGVDTSTRGDLGGFADAGSASTWAVGGLQWAVGEGILQGGDKGLNPQGAATRAEAATLLRRLVEQLVKA